MFVATKTSSKQTNKQSFFKKNSQDYWKDQPIIGPGLLGFMVYQPLKVI